ncbi:MAG: OmpH family outer membrane protein [Pseudomonadota bacterium]
MRSTKTLAVAAGAAAAFAVAMTAMAQTPPAPTAPKAAAPAAPQLRYGAAIPGVCTYDGDKAVATSELGKFVMNRLKQIDAEVAAELKAEETAILNERKALETAGATLGQEALEKRTADLQLRINAYARKKQLRGAELEATGRKAIVRVAQELDPIAVSVFQARNCSLLVGGDSVLIANPQMDITDQVIAGLNAKIKTITFNRERLDTPPAAPAAPAAAAPAPRRN